MDLWLLPDWTARRRSPLEEPRGSKSIPDHAATHDAIDILNRALKREMRDAIEEGRESRFAAWQMLQHAKYHLQCGCMQAVR